MWRYLAALLLSAAACGDGHETVAGPGGVSSTGVATASGATGGVGGSGATGAGAGGAAGGGAGAPAVPTFEAAQPLSDPASAAFVPSIAARDGQALVAWHEFVAGQTRVAYVIVEGGVAGTTQLVPETFSAGKHPSVAVTDAGYLIAYQANDGQTDLVRAIEIDATGAVTAGPDTISTPGAVAETPHVAARAGEEAFAWTDGSTHFFALRGSAETIAASPVGTTLVSLGLLNFPRVAIDDTGGVFVAYRDGGMDTTDWDTLLVVRPGGGTFGAVTNVSKSPGLLSDDISLAVEPNGQLDIAWVEQDPANVNAFEVTHATRAANGALTDPVRYGTQGLWTWAPSVVAGLACAWNAGAAGSGPIYFAAPGLTPTQILPTEQATRVSLALGPDGFYHLAFYTGGPSSQVRYARGK